MFDSFIEEASPAERTVGWQHSTAARVAVSVLLPAVALPLGTFVALRLQLPMLGFLLLPGFLMALLIRPLLPPAHSDGGWFPGLGQMILVTAAADYLFYAVLCFVLYPVIVGRKTPDASAEID